MTFQQIRDLPEIGNKIFSKLLTDPISLLDPVSLNQWLKANHAPEEIKFSFNDIIHLNDWIKVLNTIETNLFYYKVARAQTQNRYKKKCWGPLLPIGNATGLVALGGGLIVGGAIGGIGTGAVGGVFVTSGLVDSARGSIGSGLTIVLAGPVLTVGGAVVTGAVGTVVGGAVATILALGAVKELTYGVAKSVVLWPTTPFEIARSEALSVISKMLSEFSKLIDINGNFNQNYENVLKNPNLMGEALYSVYLEMSHELIEVNKANSERTQSNKVALFLTAFKELVNNSSFIPGQLVYRKVKHIKSLIRLHLGCPDRKYEKISSNAGPSYVSDWIQTWEKKFEKLKKERADDSPLGRAQHGISSVVSSTF